MALYEKRSIQGVTFSFSSYGTDTTKWPRYQAVISLITLEGILGQKKWGERWNYMHM
jgi:hypothetical protein